MAFIPTAKGREQTDGSSSDNGKVFIDQAPPTKSSPMVHTSLYGTVNENRDTELRILGHPLPAVRPLASYLTSVSGFPQNEDYNSTHFIGLFYKGSVSKYA